MVLRTLICILGAALLSTFSFGQNLVPNGGFEDYKYCPVDFNKSTLELVKGWSQPTTGTIDYYNQCSQNAGVPRNMFGEQAAHGGKGYIGVISYAPSKRNYREYMQTQLTQPLRAGQQYCVEFYLSLADFSNFRTDGIGVFLSKDPNSANHQLVLDLPAQLQVPKNYVIREVNDWVKISGIVTAEGGETYITIGNFNPDHEVKVSRRNLPRANGARVWDYAYYYIDDLSLKPIKDTTECDCTTEKLKEAMANPNFVWDQEMSRIEIGGVTFDFDKHNLDSEDKEKLDKVLKMMKENDNYYLEVIGHTDSIGEGIYNDTLSKKRAERVFGFFTSDGIPNTRMRIRYYGKYLPTDDNSTSEGRARNRRVEFILWEE